MDVPAISVKNIRKTFPIPLKRRRVVAVDELSFDVRPGEVYGLLGPNGSGKSTTLKILLGLVQADQGTGEIFGVSSREVRSREKVGFLPENPYFYKYLTGEETLRFFGRLCRMRGRHLDERINELLKLVGLENARDRRLGGFSKGMLQRIGLAQALIQEPRLVVLDEPTAGVDPSGSRDIRDLILDLKRRGISVLLSSHLLAQVQEVCDRVGILARGRLVREGPVEELIAIQDQSEILIDKTSDEVIAAVRKAAEEKGAHVLDVRKPERTLERLFLDVTAGGEEPAAEASEKK